MCALVRRAALLREFPIRASKGFGAPLWWMDNAVVATDTCPSCGRPRDAHDRHVRYTLPDPVLALRRREKTPGTWMTHKAPHQSVMMQVPNVGSFVECCSRFA